MYKTPPYLINAPHRITIMLIGCGGTGSMLLPRLARLNYVLQQLGHKGIYVEVLDGDIVEEKNILRQNFTKDDIGENKAVCMVSKINMAFDTDWNAIPSNLEAEEELNGNIIISCVDNVSARKIISEKVDNLGNSHIDTLKTFLWFDCGNTRDTGQVVMSDTAYMNEDKIRKLKTIFDIYGDLDKFDTEEIQGAGCSAEEALADQDLTINDEIAHICWRMLWTLFKDKKIEYQAIFTDLKSMDRSTMKI